MATRRDGEVPSRPYLQLGVSSNVTYTYDESRKEGERITSVWVNGKPIDPKGTYMSPARRANASPPCG